MACALESVRGAVDYNLRTQPSLPERPTLQKDLF
jgi:hypothetical protein